MARPITVLVGSDRHRTVLEPLLEDLNGRQGACAFSVRLDTDDALAAMLQTPEGTDADAFMAPAPDILDRLDQRRVTQGPFDPFIIRVVDVRLAGSKLSNLFGMHRAQKGVAVFTLCDATRYLPDEASLITYFLVRYSMSFAAPDLRNHEEFRGCYFDRKRSKGDILMSATTASLCHDECRPRLREAIHPSEAEALYQLRLAVAERVMQARTTMASHSGDPMPDLEMSEEVDVKRALAGPEPAGQVDRPLPSTALGPLYTIMVRDFDTFGLFRLVRFELQPSQPCVDELPDPRTSMSEYATNLISLLERHGYLTERLLDTLLHARSHREAEIEAIRATIES